MQSYTRGPVDSRFKLRPINLPYFVDVNCSISQKSRRGCRAKNDYENDDENGICC